MSDTHGASKKDLFAQIPSVEICRKYLLEEDASLKDLWELVHPLITEYWNTVRAGILNGEITSPEDVLLERNREAVLNYVYRGIRPKFRTVLNATGVVVHTNMGRSTLCREAQEAVLRAAAHYSSLELDMQTGGRGSRYAILNDLLTQVTGAEAAMVVNNNAAAVMLMLDTICNTGEVVVSRGELVEIGGSFRIPDVMTRSGAQLREVGTTNRTHLRDYADAITPETRALMRVHTSNYRIIGFHEQVALTDLAQLAHERGVLLIEDLGSGSLVRFSDIGLPDEPTVQESIQAGADLVSFSGDKVLGGPQAGIIVGRRDLIERMKRNQLTRAIRCDKLCIAALEATVRLYIDPDKAQQRIPTLRRIRMPQEEIRKRAERLMDMLQRSVGDVCTVSVVQDVSRVGGGAFPQYDLPTHLVALQPGHMSVDALKNALLEQDPPLIGRIEHDAYCLDPRTLEEDEYPAVIQVVSAALTDRR